MSADDTIVILHTRREDGQEEFRVERVLAAEDLEVYDADGHMWLLHRDWVLFHFANSEVYLYEQVAEEVAEEIQANDPAEYGIRHVGGPNKLFPEGTYEEAEERLLQDCDA